MPKEKNKNNLSIYLIKEDITELDEILLKEKRGQEQAIDNVGLFFCSNTNDYTPKWVKDFFGNDTIDTNITISNARAVLLVPIKIDDKERKFAIVMGYGKSMLKDNVIEENFGLKVLLNTIGADNIRKINKKVVAGNQKMSNEQLPKMGNVNDFGLDTISELVTGITAISNDDDYVKGTITGTDMLNVTAEVDIENIVEFLEKTYDQYQKDTYKKDFAWIDHIKEVKDKNKIATLEELVIKRIEIQSSDIYMAVPEIITWENIKGFKYNRDIIEDDIYIDKVVATFREGLKEYKQLKNKNIIVVAENNDEEIGKWSATKCLFGEIEFDGKTYCLNAGKWYCVDDNFVKDINEKYNQAELSKIAFNEYNHKNEADYNSSFVESNSDEYILLDCKNIFYGGSNSQIEVCDVLSKNKELIHIKRYSGSATLSHLFNQALVSTELLKSAPDFLAKVNKKIEVDSYKITDPKDISVIVAIINKGSSTEKPNIPFFSKITYTEMVRRMSAFGINLKISSIAIGAGSHA